MPAYDYVCQDCGAKYEVRMSMSAYSEGVKPPCEQCGSSNVARAFTTVNVLTAGRGGGGAVASAASCGGGFS